MAEEKETGRIEAFSDGVLAIAITLLALELKVPISDAKDFDLIQALLNQWPVYFAFLLSFLFILVIWINHRRLFIVIRRADNNLLILNGLLLCGITLIPFATELLAEYLQHPSQNVAAFVYSGVFFVTSLFFNLLWRYASYRNRLFNAQTDRQLVMFITRQYSFGPPLYLLTMILAIFTTAGCMLLNVAMAIFFVLPNRTMQTLLDEDQQHSPTGTEAKKEQENIVQS